MPDARCTRGPVCEVVRKKLHTSIRAAENIRHSLRNGLTAYHALTPENYGLCRLRRPAETGTAARSGLQHLRKT